MTVIESRTPGGDGRYGVCEWRSIAGVDTGCETKGMKGSDRRLRPPGGVGCSATHARTHRYHLSPTPPKRSESLHLSFSPSPGRLRALPRSSQPLSQYPRPISPMARIKRAQPRQRSRCPICFHFFSDVLRHLNHRQSQCSTWFEATRSSDYAPFHHSQESGDTPPSPQFLHDDRSPSPSPPASSRVNFPGAGMTYGQGQTFLDRFNEDQYAACRVENMYYPFSNEDEWEFASFLLSSNLSMQKIDEFLKLKLVGYSSRHA